MRIALFDSARDSEPKPVDLTWEQLAPKHTLTDCAPCSGHDCKSKYVQAWSPANYAEDATRGNEGVRAITAAVFDLDSSSREAMALMASRLQGLSYYCHSTHALNSYRLILKLSRPVAPSEWPAAHAAMVARYNIPADPACGDLARIYFLPTCPANRVPEVFEGVGGSVDVDSILCEAAALRIEQTSSDVMGTPRIAVPEKLDLGALRAALRSARSRKSLEVKEAVLSGTALASKGARDTTINAAMKLISCIVKPPPSIAEALALVEPSIRAMDCAPEGFDYWIAQTRSKYERALVARAAETEKHAAASAELNRLCGRVPDLAPEDDWRKQLIVLERDGEVVGLRSCEDNVRLILENDAAWKNTLRWNDLAKSIEVSGGPLLSGHPSTYEVDTSCWFQRVHGIFMPSYAFGPTLLSVARRRSYDPLADYLHSLKWDGVARCSEFLAGYLGADDNPFTNLLSRKWFISAVARALRPGCKVDTVLMLEGDYGIGKSAALKALGDEFYTTMGRQALHDKDTKAAMSRYWIVEMAELASLKTSEAESIKAFFSTSEDSFRPPYGRTLENFKRRSVLVGTTNQDRYLQEPNRREWPVLCSPTTPAEQIAERVRQDRDQLWAEAVTLFNAGENWWLTPADQAQAMDRAQSRRVEDSKEEIISRWWHLLPADKRPRTVTGLEVAFQAFDINKSALAERPALLRDIGKAMKQLGWQRKQRRIGNGRLEWYYWAPDTLLKLGSLYLVDSEAPLTGEVSDVEKCRERQD